MLLINYALWEIKWKSQEFNCQCIFNVSTASEYLYNYLLISRHDLKRNCESFQICSLKLSRTHTHTHTHTNTFFFSLSKWRIVRKRRSTFQFILLTFAGMNSTTPTKINYLTYLINSPTMIFTDCAMSFFNKLLFWLVKG